MELEVGRTYYKLTFADPDLTMPGVTPMVYVGKNVYLRRVEDNLDTYEFQDTVSYVRFGFVTETEHKDECWVEAFVEKQLGLSILQLEDVAAAIAQCAARTRELGAPVLRVPKGKWVTAKSETFKVRKHPKNPRNARRPKR